ncbi:hypothetical protein ACSIGC_05175 [Tenacibaculum sp. ZS6-P6]|uniref:hypothetical protein n=1 Tax=Tenacibaculum sp. ZS6-P6 TaxID=3447503 RepID=UPI003F99598C
MKKKILLLGVLFLTLITNAQESALDKISKETCEYLTKINNMNLSGNQKSTELGLYMVKLYSKYKEDLKEEGIVVDFSRGKEGGAEFGKKIGMNMVNFCPDVLIALANEEDGKEEKDEDNFSELSFLEGEIKKISGEELYVIEIKDTLGKTQKFLWLNNFEGSDELIELGKKSKGKKVKIFYEDIEYFSPKLQEYIVRKKVSKVEFL